MSKSLGFLRYKNSTKHQIFIACNNVNETGAYAYYYPCQAGARTLRTSAWILCFLNYELHTTLDARNQEGEERKYWCKSVKLKNKLMNILTSRIKFETFNQTSPLQGQMRC